MLRKKCGIESDVNIFKRPRYTMLPWISSPMITARQYQASEPRREMTWLGSSPAMLVMVLAISANTPTGAKSMMRNVMRMTISCRPLMTSMTGRRFSSRTCTSAMPASRLKNTICSMFRLLLAEPKKLSGTMSINGCNGPRSFTVAVVSCRFVASA